MTPSIVSAEFVKSLPKWTTRELEPLPQICFAGRSNVGKSSLINALVNRKGLAKTSSTPGRTQAIVIFRVTMKQDQDTRSFHLIDLPGYGYAKVPLEVKKRWAPMLAGYFRGNPALCCCIMLLDIRRTPGDNDLDLIEMMAENESPILPVVTKSDRVAKTQRKKLISQIAEALGLDEQEDLRQVSAKNFQGVQELRSEIFALLDGNK